MTEVQEKVVWTEQQKSFIEDLLSKADQINFKTDGHANCDLVFRDQEIGTPIRVDDWKLLYVGAVLLPNILNYLVNILPQFMYPYIVAYLQDLSTEDNVLTINDLYELVCEIENEK